MTSDEFIVNVQSKCKQSTDSSSQFANDQKIFRDLKPEQNDGGNMEVINTGFKVTLLLETQSYPVDRLIPGANHLISLKDLA